jgi:hypothetical protein
MSERVQPLDLGVTWEPNAPEATLTTADNGTARLVMRAHQDDPDPRLVCLSWTGAQAVRFGPYNDEGLRHHPLYKRGLGEVLWAGEVIDSSWREEVKTGVYRAPHRHFVVPTKEALVEVLADEIRVERIPIA